MLPRGKLAKVADAGGIGPLRRVYRTRNEFDGRKSWILIGGGLLTTTIYFNLSPTLAYVVAALAIASYLYVVYFTDTGDPAGWYRIGVADGGLVLAPRYGGPIAVPWPRILGVSEIREFGARRGFEVAYVGEMGRGTVLRIVEVNGRGALIRSITERHAIRPPVLVRSVVGGVLGVALLMTAWLVFLPDFVVRSESLPGNVVELSRACERAGAKYPDAAAFTGPAPHPIRAFVEDEEENGRVYEAAGVFSETTPGFDISDPTQIQLVACVRRTGVELGNSTTCTYREQLGSDVEIRTMRTGKYTVEVFELRTRKRVDSFGITGSDAQCPDSYVGSDDGDMYSQVTSEDLRRALDRYVTR
ncbi:hypothetical protein [Plantactinospora soyae]|uniref:Uncharacterized protein n=1 Tax=Plantactinospora soyae TaxID=1544732 RepID=A0A927MDK4_9ACTN|nr:hypothetical protein [Plantactinospora soyae]MBE1492474.1 hypothetical protein [Plantactinospora soyae]